MLSQIHVRYWSSSLRSAAVPAPPSPVTCGVRQHVQFWRTASRGLSLWAAALSCSNVMRVGFKISVASLIYQCYMSPHCSGVSLVIRQLDNSRVFCLSFFGSVCSRSLQFSFTSCRSAACHHEHLLCLISCFIWSLRSDVTFVLAVSSALGLYCTSPPVRLLEKVVRYCLNKQTN